MPKIDVERYELQAAPTYDFAPHRRDFLKVLGGGLVILLELDAQQRDQPTHLGAWLHIAQSGAVTVYSGKAEVGQNIRTSLAQAVAEELSMDPRQITLILGDTALTPYDMGTFGSRTTPFMAPHLHKAAAAARDLLLELGSQHWKTALTEVRLEGGRVHHGPDSLSFGELTQGRQLAKTITGSVVVPPAQWKVAGQSLGKVNARSIVTGREKYTSDLKVPGMLYGRVVRPTAFRADLVSADLSAAQKMSGVTAVKDGAFLGVVCDDSAKLQAATQAVKAEWKAPAQISAADLFPALRKSPPNWQPVAGEVRAEATYTLPYIAHVPLEPRAAVAIWEGDRLTVHTGTQVPFGVHAELAKTFGLPEANVRVIVPPTGSGYGGKHSGECAVEAARLAKAAGKPVKLQWTREDEFTWAYFRPAGVIEVRSGARPDGVITDWQFHNYNSGGAALRSPYHVPNQIAEFHGADSPLRQGSYRGLAAVANHFARESHMDELALAAKLEPAAFRLKNASDARLRAVIEAATERFRWGRAKDRAGQGFGMMAGFDKGGYVSACVEITVVNQQVRIERIVQSFECGAIVNPDQLKNQIVGGTIMGLGGALFEAIRFENGRILNPRFSQYRVPRFQDIPEIEVVLVDRKDLPSAGAGETPIVAVAPALGNAIYDATRQRLRALPLKLG